MTRIQELKRPIRAFMQAHYSDEDLAAALAHAQDGQLCYVSCCCFIGIPTREHALQGFNSVNWRQAHLTRARLLDGAWDAESSISDLGGDAPRAEERDAHRRLILIPMLKAEMRRRERARALQPAAVHVTGSPSEDVALAESAGVRK